MLCRDVIALLCLHRRRERDDMKSECTRLRDDFDERLFIEIEQQLKDESMALKSESDSSVSSSRDGTADVTSPPRAAAARLASPRQALRVTPSRDSAAAAVDELRVLRETVARDRADAESCMLDLHRELARYKDQNKCLHAEMVCPRFVLEQILYLHSEMVS